MTRFDKQFCLCTICKNRYSQKGNCFCAKRKGSIPDTKRESFRTPCTTIVGASCRKVKACIAWQEKNTKETLSSYDYIDEDVYR